MCGQEGPLKRELLGKLLGTLMSEGKFADYLTSFDAQADQLFTLVGRQQYAALEETLIVAFRTNLHPTASFVLHALLEMDRAPPAAGDEGAAVAWTLADFFNRALRANSDHHSSTVQPRARATETVLLSEGDTATTVATTVCPKCKETGHAKADCKAFCTKCKEEGKPKFVFTSHATHLHRGSSGSRNERGASRNERGTQNRYSAKQRQTAALAELSSDDEFVMSAEVDAATMRALNKEKSKADAAERSYAQAAKGEVAATRQRGEVLDAHETLEAATAMTASIQSAQEESQRAHAQQRHDLDQALTASLLTAQPQMPAAEKGTEPSRLHYRAGKNTTFLPGNFDELAIPRDGNCFYESICRGSKALGEDVGTAAELRAKVVDYLKQVDMHADFHDGLTLAQCENEPRDVLVHRAKHGFGGPTESHIIERLCGVRAVIVTKFGNKFASCIEHKTPAPKTFHICWERGAHGPGGDHYTLVQDAPSEDPPGVAQAHPWKPFATAPTTSTNDRHRLHHQRQPGHAAQSEARLGGVHSQIHEHQGPQRHPRCRGYHPRGRRQRDSHQARDTPQTRNRPRDPGREGGRPDISLSPLEANRHHRHLPRSTHLQVRGHMAGRVLNALPGGGRWALHLDGYRHRGERTDSVSQ